jgi:ABC-2 type transport system ATP-binding protein
VIRALERVGLVEKRNTMIVELSRGMRQRLMLAKTLLPEPRVLILDEPASGVDPQGRADLKNILRAEAAEGRTVLISSHILAEMTEFCTAVAIMEKGRLVVSGTIAEVSARVLGAGVLHVELLGPADEFLRIVAADPRVSGPAEPRDGGFDVLFRGDRGAAGDLLAALVRGGVRVTSFAPRRSGLEELFLKVGAKELS